jgi:hypothetical protein
MAVIVKVHLRPLSSAALLGGRPAAVANCRDKGSKWTGFAKSAPARQPINTT